ncbi:LCP family protein [Streptomyces pactum]|nr:LytR C-terminal domain-containing protein [Streptomyces pactum]
MNDGQDPYGQDPYGRDPYGPAEDPYAQGAYDPQQQTYGYDAYGRPVHPGPADASSGYDRPYATHDAYGSGPQTPGTEPPAPSYGAPAAPSYGTTPDAGTASGTGNLGWGDPRPAAPGYGQSGRSDLPYGDPYGGQGDPYAGQGAPYGGQGDPYAGQGDPYGNRSGHDPQGYGAQGHPGQQGGGPQSPAGARPPAVPGGGPAGPDAALGSAGRAGARRAPGARGRAERPDAGAGAGAEARDRAEGPGTLTMPAIQDGAGASGTAAPGDPSGTQGASAGTPGGPGGGGRRRAGGPEQPEATGRRARRAQRGRARGPEQVPAGRTAGTGDAEPEGPYRTEQFSFVEEQDEESEDVIDWLKFAETRTERRDERRRRTRIRLIALVAVLALAVVGGVGYLWAAGKLPGQSGGSGDEAGSGSGQKRDVIVLHLHETGGAGDTSTVLLVDNETAGKGTAVLLPNALAVAAEEGGATTLGRSVEESSDATREALGTLLGTDISGTWRLDTPYLENLVELVDGITVDADATVPAAKQGADPLVTEGKGRALSGQAAVAYATYRSPAEPQTKQLSRFGQVMHAVLKKMSDDPGEATSTVEALAQIPDPSLSESELGASLARLAERAKKGAYETTVLPVEQDGTLSEEATDHVVEDILGGTVKNTEPGGVARVSVRNASGEPTAGAAAQIALINGGFTVVAATDAGGSRQSASRVSYTDEAQAAQAREVARTLGLPDSAVAKGKGAANADVTVVLGADYEGTTATTGGGDASGGASGGASSAGAGNGATGGDTQGTAAAGTTGAAGTTAGTGTAGTTG